MPSKRHKPRSYNAKTVLPAALLKKVQEYAAGKTLYIPARPNSRKDTQMRIIAMYNMGARQCDIARYLGLNVCYVGQVVRAEKKRVAQLLLQAGVEG